MPPNTLKRERREFSLCLRPSPNFQDLSSLAIRRWEDLPTPREVSPDLMEAFLLQSNSRKEFSRLSSAMRFSPQRLLFMNR